MIKDLKKYFSKKFYASIQCFTIMVTLCLILNQSWAQKRQLTASDKINKVAVIDHSRLRKEYKEFAVSKEKLAKENKSEKEKFEKELPSGNRTEITNKYQMNQKKRNQDRIAITQEYELKINAAIAAIVSEGGFTEVKSLVKDSSVNRRIDITDLVLKKLN